MQQILIENESVKRDVGKRMKEIWARISEVKVMDKFDRAVFESIVKNGDGFIFGVPGSGKSFFAKLEMGSVFLNMNDDIIIIDPQNEYFDIANRFGGAIVVMSTYTDNYINPLDQPKEINDVNGLIAEKGEFMLGICEQCLLSLGGMLKIRGLSFK